MARLPFREDLVFAVVNGGSRRSSFRGQRPVTISYAPSTPALSGAVKRAALNRVRLE